ncbi:MAG: pitrilysin family protein [Patescibacteria group bacterium]
MKLSKKVLRNGLRVITVPMKDNPTVTVLVLVEAGSKYEEKRVNGISHFLEHMCFKGTIKRPKAIDISKELDALGSEYNAFTAQEYTGYYAKAEARHFRQIFDVVTDIYLNSTFPEKEMEKEKGVIIEEINMYQDLPNRHVQDLAMKLLYGDQPAGWNIAGEKENIRKMKRLDFLAYKGMHYLPEATVIVAAGQVSEKEVLDEIKKVFGEVPRGQKVDKRKVAERQTRPGILSEYKKTDQTHFVLAARSHKLSSQRSPSLAVLAGVLGGGMSSRLFQKLREEMGVGYYVRAHNDPYTDHGVFQVSAGVTNQRLLEVIGVILEECKRMAAELISPEELEKVKEYLIGTMKLSLESSDSIASFYGLSELLQKKLQTIDERSAEIRAVTREDLRVVSQEIFKNRKLNLALVGPIKKDNDLKKIFVI